MKREFLFALVIVGAALAPAASYAQAPAGTGAVYERTPSPVQAPVEGRRIVVSAMETRITPDRPYSAEAVTETAQALADGNRINRQSLTRVYRDSAGRTRRETVDAEGAVQTITISDPVAQVTYTLNPKTRVAYKGGNRLISAVRTPGGVMVDKVPAATAVGAGASRTRTTAVEGAGYASIARSAGPGGRGGAVATTTGHMKRDVLEPQNIEGVSASGTRTTTTIPAGQIGNSQELRIVSEQWFSEELQVLVLTKHSDPRSGETTYRLRNILRAEPDPSLFSVPADYTLQERTTREPQ